MKVIELYFDEISEALIPSELATGLPNQLLLKQSCLKIKRVQAGLESLLLIK